MNIRLYGLALLSSLIFSVQGCGKDKKTKKEKLLEQNEKVKEEEKSKIALNTKARLLTAEGFKEEISIDGSLKNEAGFNQFIVSPINTNGFSTAVLYSWLDQGLYQSPCYLSPEAKKIGQKTSFESLGGNLYFAMENDNFAKSYQKILFNLSSVHEFSLPGKLVMIDIQDMKKDISEKISAPEGSQNSQGSQSKKVKDTTKFCKGNITLHWYGLRGTN